MGTHIGNNVIIGAGSVVHGTLQSDSVYAGNPARKICSLKEYETKCAKEYTASAKEYAKALSSYLGRIPEVSEMYEGYKPLFGYPYKEYIQNNSFPFFKDVRELLDYDSFEGEEVDEKN